MKKFLFLSLFFLLVVSVNAQTYNLVWSDEFNENNIDANWNKEVTDKPANNELQAYVNSPRNIDVVDGNLVLTARRETKGTRYFLSGRVNTKNKVNFKHGVIRARIKLPKTKGGLWPAFWMMGEDISMIGWPHCGEIDILECGHSQGMGGNEETFFSAALHWGKDPKNHSYLSYTKNNAYSVEDDYHIWTCVWTEETISCYLDDQTEPYFTTPVGTGHAPSAFVHKPNFILLNIAVGGDFPGILNQNDVTALPKMGSEAKMLIDWVRVYQPAGGENIVAVNNDKNSVPAAERVFTLKANN